MSSYNFLVGAVIVLVIGSVGLSVAFTINRTVRLRRDLKQLAAESDPFESPLSQAGVRVPISWAFGAREGVFWLRWARNSLNPLLVLHDNRIEYRTFSKQSKTYPEIERAGVSGPTRLPEPTWHPGSDRHIELFFTDGTKFYAYMPNRVVLARVLAFLERKGVTLTEGARALMKSPEGS